MKTLSMVSENKVKVTSKVTSIDNNEGLAKSSVSTQAFLTYSKIFEILTFLSLLMAWFIMSDCLCLAFPQQV